MWLLKPPSLSRARRFTSRDSLHKHTLAHAAAGAFAAPFACRRPRCGALVERGVEAFKDHAAAAHAVAYLAVRGKRTRAEEDGLEGESRGEYVVVY